MIDSSAAGRATLGETHSSGVCFLSASPSFSSILPSPRRYEGVGLQSNCSGCASVTPTPSMRRSSMLSSSAARSGVKSHCRTSPSGDSQRPLHRAGRILVSSTNTCTLVINTLPLLWARQRGGVSIPQTRPWLLVYHKGDLHKACTW